MEAWNPNGNTIEVLMDVVKPGEGYPVGLARPQMFAVNNQKELLAFFGFADVKTAYGEVWRFNLDTKVWSKESTLSHGKYLHVAFPVDGLTC